MACDIRPVISSTRTIYVNPYQTPPDCKCTHPPARGPHSIPRSQRCRSHGCCRREVTVYLCPRLCRRMIKYHRYVRVNDHEGNHPVDAFCDSYPRRPRSRSYASKSSHAHWPRLRTFDREPDFHAVESADLRFAISELLDIGGILLHAEDELEKARLRIERERARHRSSHGDACERVLQEWECSWTRRVTEMEKDRDDLKLSTEVLADCWVKYVGLLRRYESLGQRRVGGIVEEDGRRRRKSREARSADEESRPWRFARRESWGRTGSGQACSQERERKRQHTVPDVGEVDRRRRGSRGSAVGEERRRWWGI
ncbi:hypothetical protein CCHL11_02638 [Colletotrichum chlorophyti]|uniref:Uncharacterized protein n=1 Tax=Colletotrichum chlorophyti TaxID=708187 RepID=A0A1Q8S8T7_9PEZI|nr:hypothetical protein CCHL11_02638 [Colletotrichum chlorophyti]